MVGHSFETKLWLAGQVDGNASEGDAMPYYFGEGDPGWDESMGEDDDDRPPKLSQFHYLPPPDIGGPPDPVHFSDKVPEPPASHLPQHWLALVVLALREIGVRCLYVRYDGGNDEGFAWLDHVELRSGERLAHDEAGARLDGTELRARLIDADLWSAQRDVNLQHYAPRHRSLGRIALDEIAIEFASRLLGRGYGTGPFWLYGAFTADLDACTIADDRNAEPVVQNIQVER
jgi:hypothetical protein